MGEPGVNTVNLMRMELTHLRSFYVIARERSVTRAATRLGLTQPALSIQMKTLEAELGEALFLRQRKQMQLTQAGRNLLPTRTDSADHPGGSQD